MTDIHSPLPRDNVRTPQQAIEKLRDAEIEYVYAFKSGKQVLKVKGDEKKVSVENKHLFRMKDAIVVHNHPQGTSFSIDDIITIIRSDVKEGILVTRQFIYHVYRPSDRWDIDVDSEEFLKQLEVYSGIVDNELEKAVERKEIRREEKEIERIHYIWMFFFRELNGVRYVRKKIT